MRTSRLLPILFALAAVACGRLSLPVQTSDGEEPVPQEDGGVEETNGGEDSDGGTDGGEVVITCDDPLPAGTFDLSVVSNVPTDFDPTSNPQPTTTILFTLMLPERCPGQRFPLVLQSHGYGGTRLKTMAADATLNPEAAHFDAINKLVQALPHYGYAVISYDERGHGTHSPGTSPHRARIIDPMAETQDAIAVLDWAHDNAEEYFLQTEPETGIAKDVRVGTIGFSYGGGFEMPLAALDPRVDTIVPNGTWNNLLYSLLPGDGVKLSYTGLLCALASGGNVNNTPLVQTLCNLVGPQGLNASSIRTHLDLTNAANSSSASPRRVTPEELDAFFGTHGTNYFEARQQQDLPWEFGETVATLRPVDALFIQGNRDVLFNLTDAYRNYAYFKRAGGDVRLLTTEGGHMNPLAEQKEASGNCGAVSLTDTVLGWFDQKLKRRSSAAFTATPRVCISVTPTPAKNVAPAVAGLTAVLLDEFPVGSLSGAGGISSFALTLDATVPSNSSQPVFVPVTTIADQGTVLAGIPRLASLTVTPGSGSSRTPVAYVGVGVRRNGVVTLVDEQLTAFVEGEHVNNRGMANDTVLLPGVGEVLEVGDEVGLLFYEKHVQYAAVVSASNGSGSTSLVNTVAGTSLPPLSAADTSGLAAANPYVVSATAVELPLLVPGVYPNSAWSKPVDGE